MMGFWLKVMALALLQAVIVFGIAAGYMASAHDDADWIRKGEYQNWKGHGCCGKDDCTRLSPHQWAWRPDMSAIDLWNGEWVAREYVHRSTDNSAWRCRYVKGKPTRFSHDPENTKGEGWTRCVFVPMPDS